MFTYDEGFIRDEGRQWVPMQVLDENGELVMSEEEKQDALNHAQEYKARNKRRVLLVGIAAGAIVLGVIALLVMSMVQTP